MNGSHAAGQVLVPLPADDEARLLDHGPEGLLRREPRDALHQVLVAVAVPRHQLPDQRDRPEAPPLVRRVEQPAAVHLAELQAGEHAPRLQHPVRLREPRPDVAEVPDPERYRVEVEAVRGDAAATARGGG